MKSTYKFLWSETVVRTTYKCLW